MKYKCVGLVKRHHKHAIASRFSTKIENVLIVTPCSFSCVVHLIYKLGSYLMLNGNAPNFQSQANYSELGLHQTLEYRGYMGYSQFSQLRLTTQETEFIFS